jgi:outer membrane protein assembly factor BamB
LPNEVDATPAIGQDRVIFKTVDGCVLAMDLKTGIHLWSYHHSTPLLVLRPSSAPKIAGDKVIVGFSDGMLVALNLFRGTLLWENNITYPQGITTTDQMIDIAADLVLSNDVIYVVTYQGKLAAVSLQSGRSLWERSFSSYSGLALGYGKLYASDSKGDLWAFRCSTGQLLWHQTQLRYRKVTAPVIFGDSLVIGDGEGYIHWFTQKTGQPLAWYWVSEDNRIISRPAVLYPFVCVQTQEGSLSIITYTTLAI